MLDMLLMLKKILGEPSSCIGMIICLLLLGTAALAPFIAPFPNDITDVHLDQRLQKPSWEHPFGTDGLGRDILSRVVFGTRVSLMIAVIVVGLSSLIGVPLGLIAGYYESWFSRLIMSVSNVFLAFPRLVFALALAAALGRNILILMMALIFTYWPWFTRTVVAETKSLKKSFFIEACESMGISTPKIILLHVLPNVSSPLIVRASIGFGYAILVAAALGFLGAGAQPPTPEWGLMIAESRALLPDVWWGATFPGLAIMLVVIGFNLLGDGIRDALDPRLRRSRR